MILLDHESSSKNLLNKLFLTSITFACLFLLYGCGSSTPDEEIVDIGGEIELLTYTDTFIQLEYPTAWVLDTNPCCGLSAQFLSQEMNQIGGVDNCSVNRVLIPDSNLIEVTESALIFFDEQPEVDVMFLTVNDLPVSRVSGNVTVGQITAPSAVQMAYADEYLHQLTCSGSIPDETISRIFNSMALL